LKLLNILYSLGILSAIHIGFQYREYFANHEAKHEVEIIKDDKELS